MKIFLKPDRDQTEVFSTSNFYGYATECRVSLSNQNFTDLIQTISVPCDIYLLTCLLEPFYIDHKRLNKLTKTKLFQLNLLNFSLLLTDERGRYKLKLKHWHKSKY